MSYNILSVEFMEFIDFCDNFDINKEIEKVSNLDIKYKYKLKIEVGCKD